MAFTGINSEDRLVQATFADYMRDHLGWESVYAFNTETFGPGGSLGRADERDAVLAPDLKAAIARLNPDLPEVARQQAFDKLTHVDFSRDGPTQPDVLRLYPRRCTGVLAGCEG